MKRVEAQDYVVTEGRKAFVFARSDEVATIPLETGETLVPLDFQPGNELRLRRLNSSDDGNGYEVFTVSENERVFAIATIASLGLVD